MKRRTIVSKGLGISLGIAAASLVLLAAPQTNSDVPLSQRESRGKRVFIQRCSLCHLPPLGRPAEVKPFGPPLNGYLKSPEIEARARESIRKGTPRMPGFQYGLTDEEIGDVMAYIKAMR